MEAQAFVPTSILVTGGAGFIASHVVLRLVTLYPQYKVVVLDKLDYGASLNNLKAVMDQPNFKFIKGDITSMDTVRSILAEEHIDCIMHFAAQTNVDYSFTGSIAFTMTNTLGTHVLLEAARTCGHIGRFINVSTDEVYGETSLGKAEGLPEDSLLDPTNPYAASKAGAEHLARSYFISYKMPIIITRGNNVYGPHQFPDNIIPKFTLLASRGAELPIHGDGSSMRSYLYVEDVAGAFDCILHKGVHGETYNIGTERELSVKQVTTAIASHFSLPPEKVVHVRDRAFNDKRYYIATDKLAALGWRQSVPFEEGLTKTIDWYLKTNVAEYWYGNVEAALEAHPDGEAIMKGGKEGEEATGDAHNACVVSAQQA